MNKYNRRALKRLRQIIIAPEAVATVNTFAEITGVSLSFLGAI